MIKSFLLNINKWNLKALISDLLFFVFQFPITFALLWIWKHTVFTLIRRLKCLLNLSFEQQEVSPELLEKLKYKSVLVRKFWSASYKSVHDRPDSPSWYPDSWPYTVPRVQPHCQLPSLLVHWSYQERNAHTIP